VILLLSVWRFVGEQWWWLVAWFGGEVEASKLFLKALGYLNANVDWPNAECGVAKKLEDLKLD